MGYLGGLLARNYNNDRQQNVNANNRPSNGLGMILFDVLWIIIQFVVFILFFDENLQ